jgi:hypothetical protein
MIVAASSWSSSSGAVRPNNFSAAALASMIIPSASIATIASKAALSTARR